MGKTIGEQVVDVEITVADNATATPDVSIQFVDIAGNNISHPVFCQVYLTTDAAGQTLAADGTDSTEIAIFTDGAILSEPVVDIMIACVSEADGLLGITPTVVDGKSVYINVVMPNGEVVTHPTVLTWAS